MRRPKVLPALRLDLIERRPDGLWRASLSLQTDDSPEGLSPGLLRAVEVANWIEANLKVRSKGKGLVPLRFNAVQELLMSWVAWRWHNGLAVYVINPKARQHGVSTFWSALGFALATLLPMYRCGTIAHDEDSVNLIFGITRHYYKALPDEWRQDMANLQQAHYEWDAPKGSFMTTASAKKSDAVFKGPTLNYLHLSEAANYADNGQDPLELWSSAQGALHHDHLTIVAIESTAKGRDIFFYYQCLKAQSGKSHYTLIFLPWYLDPDYSMSWDDYRALLLANPAAEDPGEKFVPTEDEINLRAAVRDMVVAPSEVLWRHQAELSDEQLIWRRWAIEEKCQGNVDLFRRYFPSFLEECFSSTEKCFFDPKTLAYYRAHAYPPIDQGNLVNTAIAADTFEPGWVPRPGGRLKLWEYPKPGEEYVIGADPAEGLKLGDPSSAYVLYRYPVKGRKKVVAAYHGKPEWEDFAEELFLLGLFFNTALVVPENNVPAVAGWLHRRNYPNLYYYRDEDVIHMGREQRPGYNTNRLTRNLLLNALHLATRGRRVLDCPDLLFAKEMGDFVLSEKGKYEAAAGKHDDRIFAMSLALICSDYVDDRVKQEEAAQSPAYRTHLWLEQRKRESQRRERNGRGFCL